MADPRRTCRPRANVDEELLIPESVAVRVFNRLTGADCRTIRETVEYLDAHPEVRKRLAESADG